jgi:hypothetical protein
MGGGDDRQAHANRSGEHPQGHVDGPALPAEDRLGAAQVAVDLGGVCGQAGVGEKSIQPGSSPIFANPARYSGRKHAGSEDNQGQLA